MPREYKVKKITATLPALGTYTVPFYKESSQVLNFLGEKELKRLSKIAHLGTAATVFTGINHSRLEYMLLQCAVINLLPKFNLGTEQFAIGGKVKLAGGNHQVSSGEELLKCWSILSNTGHAQYTYGVERSLLSYTRKNAEFQKLVLSIIRQPDLKQWSKRVIDSYRDSDFHWVLSIIRISQQVPPQRRYKRLFIQYFRNLLLPLDELDFNSHADRYKIYRLREIFEKVRLLSLVTLDSYYSHQPVRYQVSTAIMDLENLFSDRETGFESLLRQTASWLADELYMHPNAAATLRYYEIQSRTKFHKHYSKWFKSVEDFKRFMTIFMQDGFGQPSNDHLRVFLRVTLSEKQAAIFRDKDTYDIRNLLEKQMSKPRRTRISVLINPFSKALHIDLLYDFYESKPFDIGQLCCGFYLWFLKAIEAQVNSNFRSLFAQSGTEFDKVIENLKKVLLKQNIDELNNVFSQVIKSTIRYLIPEDLAGSIVEFIPSSNLDTPFLTRLRFNEKVQFDNIKESLKDTIVSNPNQLHQDRVQELKAIKHVVQYSRAPFLIACTEKFILRDAQGKHHVEWDGIILEISEKHAYLSIIEAKNKSTDHQNEKEAFDQLLRSRNIIRLKQKITTTRVRIPALGARLKITLC